MQTFIDTGRHLLVVTPTQTGAIVEQHDHDGVLFNRFSAAEGAYVCYRALGAPQCREAVRDFQRALQGRPVRRGPWQQVCLRLASERPFYAQLGWIVEQVRAGEAEGALLGAVRGLLPGVI